MIRGRRLRYLAAVALAAGILASATARAENLPVGGGCFVTGDVNGYEEYRECTYVAQTGTQTIYAASPNHWRAYVWREFLRRTICDDNGRFYECDAFVLEQVDLGSGYGQLLDEGGMPRAPGPIEIHPIAGETVHLEISGACHPASPTNCGKQGLVGAYE